MKRFAFLLLTLSFALISFAGEVTEAEALQKAQRFWDKASISRRASRKAPELVLANKRDEFYVFNDRANGGYVVVSGENRMPDILGYSYEGCFDADNIPCNMQAWLEGYAEQVKYLRTHPEAKAAKHNAPGRGNVGPLLTCQFTQSYPYNAKCPDANGYHTPTGCVATAMAQIMYYWQWPKQTTDVIPGYTTYTYEIDMPAQPITTIDWNNILNKYVNWENYTEGQIDAISTLMLLCGTSVHMNYVPGGSGSSSRFEVIPALTRYFGYDDVMEVVDRDSYDSDVWEQLIYDEISCNRPVLYSAGNGSSGHSFVLDGYEDGYFHVNWGWGDVDSWVLMTGEENWFEFTIGHNAIVGIHPVTDDYPSQYGVLDNGTMTLYYDKKKSTRSGTILKKDEWENYKKQIKKCVIDPSFANLSMTTLYEFFLEWSQLESIEGIENLNTSMVSEMSYMFYGCSSLKSLDVSSFKTDKVTRMSCMFYGCSSLKSLDVSGFKTDNVTSMGHMFENCSGLTSLDLSGFKTDKVTDMSEMFGGCSGLTSLDLSGFKTDNVTYMESMFADCSSLKSLDVSGFKTDNVTDMGSMFRDCYGLTSLDVSGFKTDKVTYMGYMFRSCYSLTSLDVSGFKTDKVTGMNYMFYDCPGLTSLDLSGFKTDNVNSMSSMFAYNSNLTTIYASESWNMANVEYSKNMFSYCANIVGGAGTTYDQNHTDGEYARIDEGTSKPGYFTYKAPPVIEVYKLTYILDGEEYKTYEVEYGATIKPEPAPVKDGYTFSGWSEIPETMPAHDVTVTGSFTINQYTITYMIDNEVFTTVKVDYGSTITPPTPPVRDGYDFAWGDYPETMPAYDITIYGAYTTGIDAILAGENSNAKIFAIDGRQLKKPQKGLNIIRKSDGTTKKVVVK